MRESYQERTAEKAAAVKEAMRTAERDMWRCDPREHRDGETYVELTQLLQGHIQNEVDMNSDSSCRENCAYYSYAKSHGCYHSQVCAKLPRCNGKLIDCQYIDSDMWVCQSVSYLMPVLTITAVLLTEVGTCYIRTHLLLTRYTEMSVSLQNSVEFSNGTNEGRTMLFILIPVSDMRFPKQ